MKKLALILILFSAHALAQVQITTNAQIQNNAVAPFRSLLLAEFGPQVDADENGVVSNAEALAWLSDRKIQRDLVEFYVVRAVLRAETADPATLTQAHRDAITALAAAQANLQAQRELLCPGCSW